MNKKIILKLLKDSMINNKVISIHTNRRNPDSFSAGIVIKYNEDDMILKSIDYYGEYDGYIARKISTIFKVEIDTKYNNTLYKLYNLKKQNHLKIQFNENCNINIYKELTENAMKNNLFVYIKEKKKSSYTAKITKIEKSVLHLNIINQYGIEINNYLCNIADIQKINCDTKDEQCIKLLNEFETNSKTEKGV